MDEKCYSRIKINSDGRYEDYEIYGDLESIKNEADKVDRKLEDKTKELRCHRLSICLIFLIFSFTLLTINELCSFIVDLFQRNDLLRFSLAFGYCGAAFRAVQKIGEDSPRKTIARLYRGYFFEYSVVVFFISLLISSLFPWYFGETSPYLYPLTASVNFFLGMLGYGALSVLGRIIGEE